MVVSWSYVRHLVHLFLRINCFPFDPVWSFSFLSLLFFRLFYGAIQTDSALALLTVIRWRSSVRIRSDFFLKIWVEKKLNVIDGFILNLLLSYYWIFNLDWIKILEHVILLTFNFNQLLFCSLEFSVFTMPLKWKK